MSQQIFLISVVATATLATAQVSPNAERLIRAEGLANSRVMNYLDQLSNGIGHRLTGSDNFTRACNWAKSEFEKLGLEARLEKWDEWKIVWNRGQWSGRVLTPTPMELHIATPAWTAPTRGRQRGELVKMPSLEAMESAPGQWKGKYLLGRIPSFRARNAGAVMKALEASGALGLVGPPSGGGDRRYPNQIRVFGNSNVARGSMDNLPKVPQICVRPDQLTKLTMMVEAGKKPEVEFEIRNRFRRGPIVLNNVIADLKGTEKPDEYVIVCGHLDSWHQAAGATDNGTGTTSTMEVARILTAAGFKPRRTIRFILWGGEEQGLLGSKRYVTMHRAEMSNVAAVFNHDNGTNWAQSLTVSEAMEESMRKVLAPVFRLTAPQAGYEDRAFILRTRPTISARGGSDHASFAVAGVPAFSWGLQSRGNTPYGYGWHSQWDTYDIAVPKFQAHTSTVIALTAAGVANMKELLTREGVVRGGGRSRGASAATFVGALFGAELKDAAFTKIEAEGPADKVGLKKGDKIVKLNGTKMTQLFEVLRAVREGEKKLVLTVQRGEDEMDVQFATEELVKRLNSGQRRRRRRR